MEYRRSGAGFKKIEVTDKNREQGVYYVKYDPSEDSGTRVFGNVTLFIFEEEYEEAEYKLSIVWRETECEVRATKVEPTENGDEDEALGDGSAKLIEALYEAIRDELSE
nr:hypothetical protein [Methylomarinum sp. Ch1-1]MDP4522065.1 hypothetical protein [Methylomarinum sp. Ch1-1]